MVYIYTDFGVYSEDADAVEAIIRKHNHLSYKKTAYERHSDMFDLDNEGKRAMTWFTILRARRDWIESLYEDLDDCGVPVAMHI